MRIFILATLLFTSCVTRLENQYFETQSGDTVICYPDSEHEYDEGIFGTLSDTHDLSSGDREVRDAKIREMDERELHNRSYYRCIENAQSKRWRALSKEEIAAKDKALSTPSTNVPAK